MLLLVACLSCAVAALAAPQDFAEGPRSYGGRYLGGPGGIGYGRGVNSGSNYGRRGSVNSNHRYTDSGYGSNSGANLYDQGNINRHFMKITESDVSGSHNSGASRGSGRGGYSRGGGSNYGADDASYGRDYYGLGGFKAKTEAKPEASKPGL